MICKSTLNLLCAAEETLTTTPDAACSSLIVTPKKWAHCFSTCNKIHRSKKKKKKKLNIYYFPYYKERKIKHWHTPCH